MNKHVVFCVKSNKFAGVDSGLQKSPTNKDQI